MGSFLNYIKMAVVAIQNVVFSCQISQSIEEELELGGVNSLKAKLSPLPFVFRFSSSSRIVITSKGLDTMLPAATRAVSLYPSSKINSYLEYEYRRTN